MVDHKPVVLRTYSKEQLKAVEVLAGISPNAMRRVFSGWILFAAVVGAIVVVAPELSLRFIVMTMLVLFAFTVAMFAQSRIAEGWPSIIADDDYVGVVRDPQAREFICVPMSAIKDVTPTLIKPNKKAVAILLHTSLLTKEDVEVLNQAVWPRDDKLIGLAHFKSREDACERILETRQSYSKVNSSASNRTATSAH